MRPRLHRDLSPVALVPATVAHQTLLSNLLQFYIYDFSEFFPVELGAHGRFEYPQLPLYWAETSRRPFLISVNGRWAGFVFVRQLQDSADRGPAWDMAEFFVMRDYRRHGIGTKVAHMVLRRLPGSWQVRVMEANVVGRQFWQKEIESFTGASLMPERECRDDIQWHVFRFASRPE
jgi:predicted acetyltransferase